MPKNKKDQLIMAWPDEPIADDASAGEAEYASHADQLAAASPPQERIDELNRCLLEAYASVISYKEVPCIAFGDLSAIELAQAFVNYPMIVKPTLCCVNVAARAIKRDLGFDFNTYKGRLSNEKALAVAGYVKPLLPALIPVPAIVELDRYFWTDKSMRAAKGNWEKAVTDEISRLSGQLFKKRKFTVNGEAFEIDAALPAIGEPIVVAIDVKRIESPRDIHKRADEIINKAAKFKKAYPASTFYAVIYYPFQTQHHNVTNRLSSDDIDGVYFAGVSASSVEAAIDLLVGSLK
jgi:hypothetical protein